MSSDRKPQDLPYRTLPSGESFNDGTRLASIDQDVVAVEGGVERVEAAELEKVKDEPVTWASLPHRSQLVILTLARLSEPLVQTSLQVSKVD
jgi:hypothetical protein